MDGQNNAKLSDTALQDIQLDRDADLHCTKVTQAAVKLELQAPSLPCCRKMASRYPEGNAQPEQHFNVGDYYCQVNFEIVNSETNCIFEYQSKELHQVCKL